MLEHLVVVPRSGLCNRLRAIASAERIASRSGARCTIVWDWGEYDALFDDDTEWVPYAPPMDWERQQIVPGYHHIRHLHPGEGGTYWNRRVPVTTYPGVVVGSGYPFYAAEERLPRDLLGAVMEWLPRPHPEITARVAAFQQAHLPPETVGVHIRRTDHKGAIDRSPDAAYFA